MTFLALVDVLRQVALGFKGYSCGLCQTGVPCASVNLVQG